MSSAEAELIALCACAADVAYCRKLANEVGFLQLRPTIIHEDHLGAKQIAESGNFKGRSNHFELRWRETQLKGGFKEWVGGWSVGMGGGMGGWVGGGMGGWVGRQGGSIGLALL